MCKSPLPPHHFGEGFHFPSFMKLYWISLRWISEFFPKFLLPFWWRISLVPSSIGFMQLVLATCSVQWLDQFLSLGHDAGPPSDDIFEMVHFSAIYLCMILILILYPAKLCWESKWISIMMFYQHNDYVDLKMIIYQHNYPGYQHIG